MTVLWVLLHLDSPILEVRILGLTGMVYKPYIPSRKLKLHLKIGLPKWKVVFQSPTPEEGPFQKERTIIFSGEHAFFLGGGVLKRTKKNPKAYSLLRFQFCEMFWKGASTSTHRWDPLRSGGPQPHGLCNWAVGPFFGPWFFGMDLFSSHMFFVGGGVCQKCQQHQIP